MKRATVAPRMRPTLARSSSAASGFFFCGMMLEPVVKLSDSRTKRNWAEDQITSSSAKRLRCMAQIDAADRNSSAKSRSEVLSRLFAVGRSKPSAAAVMCRSMGNEVPASAAAPRGHSFIRLRASWKRDLSRASIST